MRLSLPRLSILLVLAFATGACTPQPASTIQASAPASKPLSDGLDAIAAKHGLDKAWFYLSRDDGRASAYVRGDAAGISHPLDIGSLSKSVTAMGIAVLIQDRRLTPQTRLGDVLPAYLQAMGRQLDPSLAPLDVAHLLAHRGGLRTNATSDPKVGLSSADVIAQMPTGAHFADYILKSGNDHSDGTSEYRYSNLSYVLLGMVIEAVSKQPYETFIQDRVLRPAGVAGRIPPELQKVASFSGWQMTEPDLLRLWTVFDVNHPTLLDRPTLEATLLSRGLPPTSPGSDVHYTTGAYVRQSADRRSYVVNHNGIMDFLRGQPDVYAYAEKYVPGYSWMFVFETPPRNRFRDMRQVVRDVRSLVESLEGRQ